MKKLLKGFTYILLEVIIFAYLFVNDFEYTSLISTTAKTGLPIISIILMIPAFIFTILSLCMNKKKITLTCEVFCLFTSSFALISAVLRFFINTLNFYWASVIVGVASLIIVILSSVGIATIFKEEKAKQN